MNTALRVWIWLLLGLFAAGVVPGASGGPVTASARVAGPAEVQASAAVLPSGELAEPADAEHPGIAILPPAVPRPAREMAQPSRQATVHVTVVARRFDAATPPRGPPLAA